MINSFIFYEKETLEMAGNQSAELKEFATIMKGIKGKISSM